jgi:hypothetical protein
MIRAARPSSRSRALASCVAFAAALPACGYHTVYGEAAAERLHVRLHSAPVADAVVADEVLSGAREALAREGALAPGDGWPALEIDVTRIDEISTGIAADTTGPVARASARGVVGRAWVVPQKDGPAERETGDMRAEETLAIQPSATSDALAQSDAARAAARRLGHKLALRVLGHPTASESIGR